jgi:hypothetical protein
MTSSDSSKEDYVQTAIWLNSKRNLRVAMALELAQSLRSSMSTVDCVSLGYEADANGEYQIGREYLQLGLKKSEKESRYTQVIALRALGRHFFGSGPDGDVAIASRFFQRAAAATSKDTRPYWLYMTARTHYLWASRLRNLKDNEWVQHAEEARRLYESLPPGTVWREPELRLLDELETGAKEDRRSFVADETPGRDLDMNRPFSR